MHGYGQEAIQLFEQMQQYNKKPDSVTLVSVLNACSHSGMVNEAIDIYNMMEVSCSTFLMPLI